MEDQQETITIIRLEMEKVMNLWLQMMIPVPAGFLLDLLLGDPRWMYHPVRLIGKLITALEKIIRSCLPSGRAGERIGGGILVVLVTVICGLAPAGILYAAYRLNLWLGVALETWMCYQILAVKSLRDESDRVYLALQTEGLVSARTAVSMIVGRDTDRLSEEGVTKAAVETVAENTSDGVIAPLFYMALGGAVLGFVYKAVNTMDSMIGYRNQRYRHFGTCAARLDDLANHIPARLAAWLMIFSSFLLGMDGKGAVRIYQRDRKNHKSPNAAQTESVMAGALGVQLAGDAWYFGELHQKPAIGDAGRAIEAEDIRRSHRLLYLTAILALLLFWSVKSVFLRAVING